MNVRAGAGSALPANNGGLMSRVTFVRHLAAGGIALGTLLVAAPGISVAADFDDYRERYAVRPYPPEPVPQYEPQYEPPRVHAPPPVYREYDAPRRRVEIDPNGCRVVIKRRIDEYGREVTRRIRDCNRVAYRGWGEPRRTIPRERYDEPYGYRAPRPMVPEIEEYPE